MDNGHLDGNQPVGNQAAYKPPVPGWLLLLFPLLALANLLLATFGAVKYLNCPNFDLRPGCYTIVTVILALVFILANAALTVFAFLQYNLTLRKALVMLLPQLITLSISIIYLILLAIS